MAPGCGTDDDSVMATGSVSYRGTPLTRGMINFIGPDNRPLGGPISPDGTFECRLPPGDYDVTVAAPLVPPDGWKEGEPLPEDDLRLPPKYGLRRSSGLTARVDENLQPLKFDLD
jgi:hypothetical protein